MVLKIMMMFVAANGATQPAQLCLQFRVFLVSAQTGKHTQESRTLQFWFKPSLPEMEQPSIAQEFFRDLVTPQEFPRGKVIKIHLKISEKYKFLITKKNAKIIIVNNSSSSKNSIVVDKHFFLFLEENFAIFRLSTSHLHSKNIKNSWTFNWQNKTINKNSSRSNNR